MADGVPNGTAAPSGDVEMKEEAPTEVRPASPSINPTTTHSPLTDHTERRTPAAPPQQDAGPLPPPTAQPAAVPAQQPIQPSAPPAPTSQTPLAATSAAPTPPPGPAAPTTRHGSNPPASFQPPERPNPHGSPTRVYLNQNVTPHLLEAMKYLAANEPAKPLKFLSEFLAQRSAEIEGV
ncbi:hypothetical protein H2203_004689 [Taxawa tesnikishii (nom. ined.)]|nr:hypothetical protein H2203_004689 [Dothideales sp. JES 119]